MLEEVHQFERSVRELVQFTQNVEIVCSFLATLALIMIAWAVIGGLREGRSGAA